MCLIIWFIQQGIIFTESFTQITWILSVLSFDDANRDLYKTQSDRATDIYMHTGTTHYVQTEAICIKLLNE